MTPEATNNKDREVKEWIFYVAGAKYHGLHTVITDLKEGDSLSLEPEPTNHFDPNAIKIKLGGIMLGYVPKKYSREVREAIDSYDEAICTVLEADPGADSWAQLKVIVTVF